MNSVKRLILAAAWVLTAPTAIAQVMTGAEFAAPVERYGHFALGRPHEYARVVATTDAGRRVVLELPENEVFEDLKPRIVTLVATEPQEILAIVSHRSSGARLVMMGLREGRLVVTAQSAPIGVPMRWLNPVGVADLDGDGRAEIAAVITPHIGGILKVYQRQGAALVEVAALDGFSNHVNHTQELALSMPFVVAGKTRLLVPDSTRLQLRIIALENGRLVEIGRCPLISHVTGPIQKVSPSEVSVDLLSGRKLIAPNDCRP
ncbi:MAG: hypothetical protein K2Q97_14650 [Burkholderiaceae bacterium]|nr:hypothetical protein [Burkholderiaceae bacterium]